MGFYDKPDLWWHWINITAHSSSLCVHEYLPRLATEFGIKQAGSASFRVWLKVRQNPLKNSCGLWCSLDYFQLPSCYVPRNCAHHGAPPAGVGWAWGGKRCVWAYPPSSLTPSSPPALLASSLTSPSSTPAGIPRQLLGYHSPTQLWNPRWKVLVGPPCCHIADCTLTKQSGNHSWRQGNGGIRGGSALKQPAWANALGLTHMALVWEPCLEEIWK